MNDHDDLWCERTRDALQGESDLEVSLVDLILSVSELTEDETEVADLLDGFVSQSRVQVSGPVPDPTAS